MFFRKFFLTRAKFQVEIHTIMASERNLQSKNEGPRDIGNNMYMVLDLSKYNFESQ